MIGNPKWFSRRKYTGWGFTPKTWQGWVYVIVMILPVAAIASMKSVGMGATIFLMVWALIFAVDFINIIAHLPKDERERIHEAIAERNALWAMLAVLVIAVAYQTSVSIATSGKVEFDPFVLAALVAATIVKMISNIYLDRKD